DTAIWATTGRGKRWIPWVTTPLAALDPSVGDRAVALLDLVQADAAKRPTADWKKIAVANALEERGEVLLGLGRKEEACAAWQQVLEENPTWPRYKALEKKIRSVLGVAE